MNYTINGFNVGDALELPYFIKYGEIDDNHEHATSWATMGVSLPHRFKIDDIFGAEKTNVKNAVSKEVNLPPLLLPIHKVMNHMKESYPSEFKAMIPVYDVHRLDDSEDELDDRCIITLVFAVPAKKKYINFLTKMREHLAYVISVNYRVRIDIASEIIQIYTFNEKLQRNFNIPNVKYRPSRKIIMHYEEDSLFLKDLIGSSILTAYSMMKHVYNLVAIPETVEYTTNDTSTFELSGLSKVIDEFNNCMSE